MTGLLVVSCPWRWDRRLIRSGGSGLLRHRLEYWKLKIKKEWKGETEKSELEKAKESGEVLSESNPTTIIDRYENQVVVPEGFKIAEDSAIDVTGGVVIEDVSNSATAGSQFVWIPVGKVKTANGSKTITLGRYEFAEDGTATAYTGNDYKEENAKDTTNLLNYGNTIAKDIEAFITSANNNHGYYIGRYEARTANQRTTQTEDSGLKQITVKGNEYVYNYVTQPQAAKLSQGMYTGKTFTSDLINGYAYDTAIVFIQQFGQNNYSQQISLNTSFAEKGTNNLTDITKQDKQCNIWDMASNDWEWSTETYNKLGESCVYRGGYCGSTVSVTSGHFRNRHVISDGQHCIRLTLYL